MSLPRLAVNRPITTAMLLASVLLVGAIALARLPLAWLPEIDAPFIGVEVTYPNSHPRQVEKEITKPIEEALATLSGVKKMTTTSRADGAEIILEFDWGQELDVVRMKVSEKIDQVRASLPDDVVNVVIFSFNTTDIPVVQGRIAATGVDLSQNYDLLETRVVNPLRRVPGVARVDLNGIEPPELFIDLELDKVKQHGVDVGRLVRLLDGVSSNLVLGEVNERGLRYTVRSLAAFDSLDTLPDLPIDERGLRLGDIARIRYEEPVVEYGRHLAGKAAIAFDVYKESTANTVDVVRAVNSVLHDEIDHDPLLAGIEVFVWQDQGQEILDGLNGLKSAGAIGALLATLCLYFFLRRLDATLIVSLSIPFSILAACGVFYFLGGSLNILSMMGLMLAVGMLVDNAIVVLEAIDRRLRAGVDRRTAALEGTGQVLMAVTASTATTLIVFLPLVVGSGTALTTWLKEVGLIISIALACSLFSSLTLIPLMSAHLLRVREPVRVRPVEWLEERYVRILGWTLRHRAKTFALLMLGLVIGILPFALGLVKTAMFSAVVNKRLYLNYEFDDFAYKGDAERAVDQVERFLFAHSKDYGIESVYSYFTENRAGTTVTLDREDLGDEAAKALRKEIREGLPEIPGVRVFFQEEAEEGGSTTYFSVKLFGQDSAVLYDLADEAARRVATVDGVEDIAPPRKGGRREVQLRLDRDKAAGLGLTADDVTRLIAFSLGGLRLNRFSTGGKEIDTWIALRLEDRESLADLKQIPVSTRSGRPVLLGDLASFEVVERPQEIRREDRKIQVAVRGTYEGDDWKDAKEQIAALMNAFDLPAGTSWSWNDRILEQQSQDQEMGVNFILALILVYLVMASLFESLAQPFAILFSIPFALPGVAWALALTGTPFNLMAQIGLLILMGVVVNNGIVLVDHINLLRRSGLDRDEAILQAGRERLRPILMTAATTIIGLLPLAVGGANVDGLLYFPMARTVMGGLLSSVVLTLVVLPYVMLGVEGIAAWARRVWRGSTRAPVPHEAVEPISPG